MPRETNAAKRERAVEVCERLNRRYGPVECFLDHENPFRLLIAVLLSAQTTDAQVNKVTPQRKEFCVLSPKGAKAHTSAGIIRIRFRWFPTKGHGTAFCTNHSRE